MTADVKVIGASLPATDGLDLSSLDGQSSANLLTLFRKADLDIQALAKAELAIDGIRRRSVDGASVCHDEGLFYSAGLGSIGLSGPIIALMGPLQHQAGEIKIGFSYSSTDRNDTGNGQGSNGGVASIFTSLGLLVLDVFEANKTAEQNNKLKNALDRLPNRVVQPAELFAMSQEHCIAAMLFVADERTQVVKAASDMNSLIDARLRNMGVVREELAARLRPLKIAEFLRQDGVANELGQADFARLSADRFARLEQALRVLAADGEAIKSKRDCLSRLLATERFADRTRQLLVQVRILQSQPLDSSMLSRMDQVVSELTLADGRFPVMKLQVAERCQ